MRVARRGAARSGAASWGKSPAAIIRNRSFAHSLKVSSWRLGIRASERFVCRVSTANGPKTCSGLALLVVRRSTGTARTRVGVSSNQSSAAESTMTRFS